MLQALRNKPFCHFLFFHFSGNEMLHACQGDGGLVKQESVEHLMQTNLRRIRVRGSGALQERLEKVGGVSELAVSGDVFSFSFRGEMNGLLAALNGMDVTDLLISEPSLEETFRHFYEEKE